MQPLDVNASVARPKAIAMISRVSLYTFLGVDNGFKNDSALEYPYLLKTSCLPSRSLALISHQTPRSHRTLVVRSQGLYSVLRLRLDLEPKDWELLHCLRFRSLLVLAGLCFDLLERLSRRIGRRCQCTAILTEQASVKLSRRFSPSCLHWHVDVSSSASAVVWFVATLASSHIDCWCTWTYWHIVERGKALALSRCSATLVSAVPSCDGFLSFAILYFALQ